MKVALGGYVVMLADLETAINALTKKKPVDGVALSEDMVSMVAALLAAPPFHMSQDFPYQQGLRRHLDHLIDVH